MFVLPRQIGAHYINTVMNYADHCMDARPHIACYDQEVELDFEGNINLINKILHQLSLTRFAGGAIDIEEWGIWPSSEDRCIYHIFRRFHGDNYSLKESTVHVFQSFEQADFLSLIKISMLNGWGAYAVIDNELGVTFNHDGHMRIFSHKKLDL